MLLLALAGLACGEAGSSAQSGASGGQGLDTRTITATDRTREATTGAEQGIAIDMPAFPLVIEAVRRQSGGTSIFPKVACEKLEEASVWAEEALRPPPPPEPSALVEASAREPATAVQDTKSETLAIVKKMVQEGLNRDMPPALRAELEPRATHILRVAARSLDEDSLWGPATVCAATKITATAQPAVGWPAEDFFGQIFGAFIGAFLGVPVPDEPADEEPANLEETFFAYMHQSLANAMAANTVLTPLVAELASHPHESTEALIGEFAAAFAEQGIPYMREYYKQMRLNTIREFTRDFTGSGPAPVHFTTSDGWDYQQGHSGVLLTYNGVPWYGQGYFSGKRYTLQTLHRRGTRITRTRDLREETTTTTRLGAEAGASLPK